MSDRQGPIWCSEVELSGAPAVITAPSWPAAAEARLLVRLHGESLDFVQLPLVNGSVALASVLRELTGSGRQRLDAHLEADAVDVDPDGVAAEGFPAVPCLRPPTDGPAVSVVVCTHNRGPELRDCLAQLSQLNYPNLEIVIVDNAPSDDSAGEAFIAQVGDDPRFRYVVEPAKGLSRARNRGLAEVTGEIIAYTDDDVRVDPDWVGALVTGFGTRDDVVCVTSLVCTAALNTPAEHYFDGKVAWASSCESRIYDLITPSADPLYPYAPGLFGTGAAMAFRVAELGALGGFDEALGAGTRTSGGEDLDIFVRVLQAGHALVYEPSSVVWHHHRSDFEGLRRQMFGYGSGLTAYVTKHLLDRNSRRALITRIPNGIAHMTSVARKSQQPRPAAGSVPARSLLLRELAGMAAGPLLYAAARRDVSGSAKELEKAA
jgi:glycosyltransferase involved in cell wall biosynthesis